MAKQAIEMTKQAARYTDLPCGEYITRIKGVWISPDGMKLSAEISEGPHKGQEIKVIVPVSNIILTRKKWHP